MYTLYCLIRLADLTEVSYRSVEAKWMVNGIQVLKKYSKPMKALVYKIFPTSSVYRTRNNARLIRGDHSVYKKTHEYIQSNRKKHFQNITYNDRSPSITEFIIQSLAAAVLISLRLTDSITSGTDHLHYHPSSTPPLAPRFPFPHLRVRQPSPERSLWLLL